MCIICVTCHYPRHRLIEDMLQPVPIKPNELRVSDLLSLVELSPPASMEESRFLACWGGYGSCSDLATTPKAPLGTSIVWLLDILAGHAPVIWGRLSPVCQRC